MIKKIQQFFVIQYIKWILGTCPHMCVACEFKDECLEHFLSEWDYKEKQKKNQ